MPHPIRRPVIRALLGSFALLASLVAASGTATAVEGIDTIPAPDRFVVVAGGSLAVPAGGLTQNDFGVGGDTVAETQPANGALVLGVDGSMTYTPTGAFVGTDSFLYTAGGSPAAAVTIDVVPAITATQGLRDVFITGINDNLTITVPGLLGNDVDPEDDALTVVNVSAARQGTITAAGDGSFSFIPHPDLIYVDEFTYQVTDGVNTSAPVKVLINVLGDGASYGCANNIVTIVGTPGPDTIFGTNGPDVISGRSGNDNIFVLAGDDVVCGGNGDDRIFGGAGADTIHGGRGIDKIRGGPGNNTIYGGPGTVDFLKGGPDADDIYGGAGHNRIRGSEGDDRLFGGGAVDWLFGGPGDDRLFGGVGDDVMNGGDGIDICNGGEGTDAASADCETLVDVP